MAAKPPSTPILPLELIEKVINFAGDESTKTCMLVSKQFYAGALRNIYRHQSLDLHARSATLSAKYTHLFGDQDQVLVGGSRGRHVRELHIQFVNWPPVGIILEPAFQEDLLLQLMEAFATRTGLTELYVHGDSSAYQWGSLPSKVRQGLQLLIKRPSLSHLELQGVCDFPIDILHGNETLRSVVMAECDNVINASNHAVIVPEATRFLSQYLPPVRYGLLMPRLQVLSAHHSTLEELHDSWVRAEYAREALQCIYMFDNENSGTDTVMTPAIPAYLKLSDFPKLTFLGYAYQGGSWSKIGDTPFLTNVISFLQPTSPHPKLDTMRFQLFLDQSDGNLGEEFWFEWKDTIATDSSWGTLDTVLCSDRYPKLKSVHIYLKIFNSLLMSLEPEIILAQYPTYTGEKTVVADDVKDTVQGHFIKARTREIDVVVEVCADF